MNDAPKQAVKDCESAILEERAAALAGVGTDAAEEPSIDVIPFSVRGQSYAAPVAGVREVRRLQTIARIPRAPTWLLGVTRVRSTVVPVFDLPLLLGLNDGGGATAPEWVLVLHGRDEARLGLAADFVDGVRAENIGDMAHAGAHEVRATLGVTSAGVIVLDCEALLETPAVFGGSGNDDVAEFSLSVNGDERQKGTV